MIGRPPKFNTPEELEIKIQEYFSNCLKDNLMPTKATLAMHLDTTRETLGDYEAKEDFSYAIKRAYSLIEDAWVQKLAGNNVTGSIFYLKNAFKKDWRDRHETDITSGGKPIPILGNVQSNHINKEDSEPKEED